MQDSSFASLAAQSGPTTFQSAPAGTPGNPAGPLPAGVTPDYTGGPSYTQTPAPGMNLGQAAATAAGIGGTITSILGTLAAARSVAAMAHYNRQVEKSNVVIAGRQSAIEQGQIAAKSDAITNRAIAVQAGSGLTTGGSFADLLADSFRQSTEDRLASAYGAAMAKVRAKNARDLLGFQARKATQTAVVQGGTTLLTGGYQTARAGGWLDSAGGA